MRFLLLLSVAVWIGILIFFPVVAQVAFSSLPSAHLAGLVVRGSLIELHWMGFFCGTVFLVLSIVHDRLALGRTRIFAPSHVVVLVMIALTAVSQFLIIPRMDALRISAGEINMLPIGNPARGEFDSLHAWSVRIEGAVLLLGLLLLYSVARRLSTARD